MKGLLYICTLIMYNNVSYVNKKLQLTELNRMNQMIKSSAEQS